MCNFYLDTRIYWFSMNAYTYRPIRKRKGISKCTFAVDNYLKIVKRKLKSVESFRDGKMTKLTFQGMAIYIRGRATQKVPINVFVKYQHL